MWLQLSGTCLPLCLKGCGPGSCKAPGRCSCPNDYEGDACQIRVLRNETNTGDNHQTRQHFVGISDKALISEKIVIPILSCIFIILLILSIILTVTYCRYKMKRMKKEHIFNQIQTQQNFYQRKISLQNNSVEENYLDHNYVTMRWKKSYILIWLVGRIVDING